MPLILLNRSETRSTTRFLLSSNVSNVYAQAELAETKGVAIKNSTTKTAFVYFSICYSVKDVRSSAITIVISCNE